MNLNEINRFIGKHRLFTPADTVLVALSGGADSVALLRILLGLGYRCEAAHCNFHLRGEEANRDEEFVRQLCRKLRITLNVKGFQTREEARRRHVSIEMAARDLRYEWLEHLRRERNATVVAVAHHRDDNVETFLLNLIRGTGINGLRGMCPRNGHIVRPLLDTDRQEITDYLEDIDQSYVTDSSNLQDEYTRNKIRHRLLPLIQELNPSAKESIARTAAHLYDAVLLYNNGIEQGLQHIRTPRGINIAALLQEPAPETLLHEALHPLGFNGAQVAEVFRALHGQPGKVFSTAQWRVVKDRNELLIDTCHADLHPPTLTMERRDYHADFPIPKDKNTACFDADRLTTPLSLRKWQHGDTFVPFGMKGRKKVSDYLTDRKFSLPQKERQWLLCNDNEPIWLVGERTDNRYRVTETTRRVLIVRLMPE